MRAPVWRPRASRLAKAPRLFLSTAVLPPDAPAVVEAGGDRRPKARRNRRRRGSAAPRRQARLPGGWLCRSAFLVAHFDAEVIGRRAGDPRARTRPPPVRCRRRGEVVRRESLIAAPPQTSGLDTSHFSSPGTQSLCENAPRPAPRRLSRLLPRGVEDAAAGNSLRIPQAAAAPSRSNRFGTTSVPRARRSAKGPAR